MLRRRGGAVRASSHCLTLFARPTHTGAISPDVRDTLSPPMSPASPVSPAAAAHFDLRAAARAVLLKNGFSPDFEPEAVRELAGLLKTEPTLEAGMRDQRGVLWSSIDNRESRDLDQIEAAEQLPNGSIRIFVGIADVDALVPKGSHLDAHAASTTSSLYTGAHVFPMLPEELSTDRTSLGDGVDRAAIVTEMDVAPSGEITRGDVYRALVRNRAKLVYEDVAAWLAGTSSEPYDVAVVVGMAEQLRMQATAAEWLFQARKARGALELDTGEAQAVAVDGEVVGLRVVEESRSRQLIAELMVATNSTMARFLDQRGGASIRRIVKEPKRWDRIVALAQTFGIALPATPDRLALARFVSDRHAADPVHFIDLSLAIVKMLGPGEYARERPGEQAGHFGLAVPEYAHSTAPNRRFADLVTQRLVKAALTNSQAPYSDEELDAIAARCTQKEHDARKVERTMRKIAGALLLRDRIGETFDAIVTGVTPTGTFARLLAPPAEGRIVRGNEGLDVGDALRVKLVAAEPAKGFLDFDREAPGA